MKTNVNKVLRPYEISFSGLKLGSHTFDFQIDDKFFEAFGEVEFWNANLMGVVVLNKKTTLLELHFKLTGTVTVGCDITNEPFDLPIDQTFDLVVQFGEVFNDDNDELLILPLGAHQIAVYKYFYEMAVLALPLKRIHPDVASGKMGQEYLELLQAYAPPIDVEELQEEQEEQNEIDPRWADLKKLLE